MLILALLLSVHQEDDPGRLVRQLVEKLRSESIEEREAAVRGVRSLGEPALPELRKLQNTLDAEVRGRIRDLIIELEWFPLLPPHFASRHPDGLRVLLGGTTKERIELAKDLHDLPPCLAEKIVLDVSDPAVRVLAVQVLYDPPRARYKSLYYTLLSEFREQPRNRSVPDVGRFMRAFMRVVDASDLDHLRGLQSDSDQNVRAAADLLAARAG